VSRRLDPTLNIWTLAEPLAQAWMVENRGPEARVRRAGRDLAAALERLPGLLDNLDTVAGDLAAGGLRLHPESAQALRGGSGRMAQWALWLAIAALTLGLAAII
jgi:ubiquinone biosynthesis protein